MKGLGSEEQGPLLGVATGSLYTHGLSLSRREGPRKRKGGDTVGQVVVTSEIGGFRVRKKVKEVG